MSMNACPHGFSSSIWCDECKEEYDKAPAKMVMVKDRLIETKPVRGYGGGERYRIFINRSTTIYRCCHNSCDTHRINPGQEMVNIGGRSYHPGCAISRYDNMQYVIVKQSGIKGSGV